MKVREVLKQLEAVGTLKSIWKQAQLEDKP